MGANATKEEAVTNNSDGAPPAITKEKSFKLRSRKSRNKEYESGGKSISEDDPEAPVDQKHQTKCSTIKKSDLGDPPPNMTEEKVLLIKDSFNALEKDVAKVGVVMFIR